NVTLREQRQWRRTNNRKKRRNESGVSLRRNTPPPKSGIRIKPPARTQRLIARRTSLRPPWLSPRPIPFPQRQNSPSTSGAAAFSRHCILCLLRRSLPLASARERRITIIGL